MTKHTLVWREGRATPDVLPKGPNRKKKTAGGKVIARRPARVEEEKQIAAGKWITTRPPGQSNKKSSVRPTLAKKQKNPKKA